MSRLQRGFTLVELMIIVAIIGILAAVAMPAYQDYTIRARMSEVILAMSACRTSITEVYQSGGAAPTADGWGCEIGGTSATKYVGAINTDINGVVTAVVQSISTSVNGSQLTLTPLAGNPPVNAVYTAGNSQTLFGWRCGAAADGTSIASKYLPGSCRS